MADNIISFAVKGIAGGIGLASESISAHRANKRAKSQMREEQSKSPAPLSRPSSHNEKHPFEENDEDQWALDDAQDELLPTRSPPTTPGSPEKPIRDVKVLIDIFIQSHPLPNYADLPPPPHLPYPVVLPQRRPKNRSRGFIRAYAPVLMNAGIDQATFLDYLELFDKASQASPWLNAINLAGLAFSFLPMGISMAISVAIAMSVKVAMEMQSRSRTNTFLDRLNAEFFRPRGLFCLVLTWNPQSADAQNTVNLTSAVATSSPSSLSATQKFRHKFQSSSGNGFEFGETAPLIFPALEHAAAQDGEEGAKMRDKLKKKGEFVGDYWDKRAQAKYAAKNPDSMLAVGPKPEFTSRYADPNHPASSGNLISLVTGGHINPPSRRDMMMQRGQGGFGGFGGGFGGGRMDAISARREMMGGGLGGLLGGRSGMMGRDPYQQQMGTGGRLSPRGRMGEYNDYDYQQHAGRGQATRGNSPRRSVDEREHQSDDRGRMANSPELRKSMDERGRPEYLDPNYNAHGGRQSNSPAPHAPYEGMQGGGLLGLPAGPDLLKKGVKKVFGKNVLYLMIVNMPSDEEMAVANQQADAAEEKVRLQM
ncbi:uncharacterized protein PAC_14514 [Phialocephala subalpina]|uniref:Uncharacterized protein n=1 Tax=Phialocephala subalpina TaxID=576137 RepID=A0A1L7XI40_9HELO|nr:uncharacterized protein PAC_14514 [Phialocephala subalpina]